MRKVLFLILSVRDTESLDRVMRIYSEQLTSLTIKDRKVEAVGSINQLLYFSNLLGLNGCCCVIECVQDYSPEKQF